MELTTILGINNTNVADFVSKVKKRERKIKYGKDKTLTISDCLKMYDPNQHDVFDPTLRKDKIIYVPDPAAMADAGEGAKELPLQPQTAYVVRSSNPMQRLIVSRANAFLTGNPIDFISNPNTDKEKDLIAVLKRFWDNNKLDYKNNKIGKTMMSETHVAEIWYVSEVDKTNNDYTGLNFNNNGLTARVKIVAKSLGHDLYPIYDRLGDLIAFVVGYVEIDEDDKKTQVYEVYTATMNFIIRETEGAYTVEPKANLIGKIPVIYYPQDAPEWLDVQKNIERSEDLVSNFGDTNDYYSSPTTVVKGEVAGFSKKGERGKILELEENAEVDLLEWSNSAEAVKLERDILKEIILQGTQTPDISFESMKGLGNFSGVALKMLFFDASLKVKDKAETYGEGLQRRINLLKTIIAKFDNSFEAVVSLQIKPKIEPYMPENLEERINLLTTATEGKPILSQKTAVNLNPLVDDKESELKALEEQAKSEVSSQFEQ